MNKNLTTNTFITLLFSILFFLGGCATTKERSAENKSDNESLSASFDYGDDPPAISRDKNLQSSPVARAAPKEYLPKEVTFTEADFIDLWDRIRSGYDLPSVQSKHIAEYEHWFSSRPEYIERLVNRATPYLYHIVVQVEQRNLPMEIALLPAIESAYKPHALSSAKAVGLWQFIPATGRYYGLKQNWWYDGRKDVYSSTNAALNYLEKLNRDFDGDWALALASYNAGEGTVSRAIKANKRAGKPTNYTALKLRSETRRYVPKLIAFSNIIKNPEKYGLEIARVPNQPYFSVIRLSSQVELGVVADAANIPIEELEMLNPGIKRWATDPKGPHHLLVPASASEVVADAIAGIPQHKRVHWAHYKVKKGDSLSVIAKRHGISVASLKTTNKLRSSRIKIDQDLLIPQARNYRKTKAKPLRITASSKKSTYPGSVSSSSQQEPKIISVQKGDTLWSLSKRYKVTLNELVEWNKINTNDLLFRGQKLKIWRY
jgi:membrane-bound lytic murein transglycosylase D